MLQLLGDDADVPTDAHDVVGRFVVAVFCRSGQRLHESATRSHEFGGPRPDLPLQLHGVVRQVVVVGLDHQGIADPQHQFAGVHGLRQEVGGAEFEGLLLDAGIADGGQNDDGNAAQSGDRRGPAAGFRCR